MYYKKYKHNMDIDRILRAIDNIDQDRERIAQCRANSITRANGSHRNIEGSTGESKFSNSRNASVDVPEFSQKF